MAAETAQLKIKTLGRDRFCYFRPMQHLNRPALSDRRLPISRAARAIELANSVQPSPEMPWGRAISPIWRRNFRRMVTSTA